MPRYMKAVGDNPCVGDLFSNGFGIGLPQIAADRLHPLQDPGRDQAQKIDHHRLFMPGQNTQDHNLAIPEPSSDQGHIVALPFSQCNFIQPVLQRKVEGKKAA